MYTSKDIIQGSSMMIKTENANIFEQYDINREQVIGKGIYGRVHVACPKQQRTGLRLVKFIDRNFIGFPLIFYNQIENIRALNHENVLKIYEIYKDKDYYYILTEFCRDNLPSLLQKDYSQAILKQYFTMMLDSINYCHQNNICHRDIRLQSFLIQYSSQKIILKLVDLFFSYRWKENMKAQRKEEKDRKFMRMTHYTSPQILKGQEDERCDIWSLGIILYVLSVGRFPFEGVNDEQIGKSIIMGIYPEPKNISDQLKDLISKILVSDEKRIKIAEIYKHPWFNTKLQQEKMKINLQKIILNSQYYRSKLELLFILLHLFSQNKLKQIQQYFHNNDPKNEGVVNIKVLQEIFKGNSDSNHFSVLFFVRMCHAIKDSKFNYREFMYYFSENANIFRQQNIIFIFKKIDKNTNGKVPGIKMKNFLIQFNEELDCPHIQRVISFCEQKKDEFIEFEQLMEKCKN